METTFQAIEFFAGNPTGTPTIEGSSYSEVKSLIPAKTKPNYWKIFLFEDGHHVQVGQRIQR